MVTIIIMIGIAVMIMKQKLVFIHIFYPKMMIITSLIFMIIILSVFPPVIKKN